VIGFWRDHEGYGILFKGEEQYMVKCIGGKVLSKVAIDEKHHDALKILTKSKLSLSEFDAKKNTQTTRYVAFFLLSRSTNALCVETTGANRLLMF
jgi:hypothetical protein